MQKISLWKKISLFFLFKKIIKNNKDILYNQYNARIDSVARIYTVLNIPDTIIKEKEPFTSELTKKYIEKYTLDISGFLRNIGAMELCKFYTIEQVEKYSYLMIIGYSFFDTHKIAKNILFKIVPLIILILAIILFVIKFKLSIEF